MQPGVDAMWISHKVNWQNWQIAYVDRDRTRLRLRRTEECRGRQPRFVGPDPAGHCGIRPMGRRQFQGNPTGPHEERPTRNISIDSIPGKVFTGTVDSFAPATGNQFALLPADNSTGNFTKIVQRIPVKSFSMPNRRRAMRRAFARVSPPL